MRFASLCAWLLVPQLAAVADDAKPAALEPKPYVIMGVTVIDPATGTRTPHRAVLVKGDRISAVAPMAIISLAPDTPIINGHGKFLIPGLWDMHAHIAHPDYLPLFLANGVTGVREMHAFFPDGLVVQRDSIRDGKLVGPQLKIAYALVDGPNPIWPSSLVAKDAAEGRAAVRKLKEKGADFVKVYTLLSPEAFRAIAAEAKSVGLPMLGHVPESVSASEAAELGQRTMEHLYGIALATSTEEQALRQEMVAALEATDRSRMFRMFREVQLKAAATHDPAKAQALFKLFKDRGVLHTPTLTVLRAMASLDDPKFLADDRLKYMPAFLLGMTWDTKTGRGAGMAKAAPAMRKLNEFHWRMVKELHAAGVSLLAGTDCTNPYCFPGFSLHDELELLTQCGLPPLEALKAATTNAARSLGLEKEVGAIAVGQRADLLLLDADPLTDIRNTKKIHAVIVKGKLLDRKKLDDMLMAVEKNHARK